MIIPKVVIRRGNAVRIVRVGRGEIQEYTMAKMTDKFHGLNDGKSFWRFIETKRQSITFKFREE